MSLYAESSAVLAWLLGEPSGEIVRSALGSAELVLSSELTLIECDRVLIRAESAGVLDEADGTERRSRLVAASARWNLVGLDPAVVERARRSFPREPVRALDALHLATALLLREALPGLELLSLDEKLRANAVDLGLEVRPES